MRAFLIAKSSHKNQLLFVSPMNKMDFKRQFLKVLILIVFFSNSCVLGQNIQGASCTSEGTMVANSHGTVFICLSFTV